MTRPQSLPAGKDRTAQVEPARALHALHARAYFWKSVIFALWTVVVLLASTLMSSVTGVVFTQYVSDTMAALLGTFLHLCIAAGIHLIVEGYALHHQASVKWGKVFLAIAGAVLFYVFVARAMAAQDQAPLAAWLISAALLALEIVVPLALGYLMALAWIVRTRAKDDAGYYHSLRQLVETSGNPADSWNDAEAEIAHSVLEKQHEIQDATPEQKKQITDLLGIESKRLKTVRKWNPNRRYDGGTGVTEDLPKRGPSVDFTREVDSRPTARFSGIFDD